jgi:hypothetical protein
VKVDVRPNSTRIDAGQSTVVVAHCRFRVAGVALHHVTHCLQLQTVYVVGTRALNRKGVSFLYFKNTLRKEMV